MAIGSSATKRSIRLNILAGVALVTVLAGAVGGWAATTELSGALIASGSVVVDTNVKKVQHPSGGVIGELRVREGDLVRAGDVVARIDQTVTRANLAIVSKGLDELSARKARLASERDGAESVLFPGSLEARTNDPDVTQIMAGEQKLFDLRRTARAGVKAQLRQQSAQLVEEASGLSAQQKAKVREIALINNELEGVRELFKKNLVQINRLTQLEREATRLDGEQAQLLASIAQVRGKMAEIELKIVQIDQDLSSEVSKEMREIDGKIGEFIERKIAADDQLQRVDIRSPQDGTVFQLAVHTVGGVIAPGEAIMLIVPNADNLAVEAKVNPQDIEQVRLGQKSRLRFPAFNTATTPEIDSEVTRISADTSVDQRSGLSYYLIRVSVPAHQLARLGQSRLVPGMPVECFIQTGERTVMSYLLKPLRDQLARTFRER
ncbi:MAG: HlyD family type I secretion periplasmic adaptor subunit [Hyphomicrobiales bacterium]|nr:HlyD family type I secretion periplasmic adaptor subunit [Hyphomicrobiales bacterium]